MAWLVESMDLNLDIGSYGGSSSPGDRTPSVPQAHAGTIREQLVEDLTSDPDSSILLDILIHVRDAMELIKNGLFSSMEYNAATMVASKHHARKVVLNHSTQSRLADLKEQVESSKYNDPGAFGDMPFSAHSLFWHLKKEQGDIRLKTGPVRQEIFSGLVPGKGNKKSFQNRPSYNINYSNLNSDFRRPRNYPSRGRGRGRARGRGQKALPWTGPANQQKQGPQQNSRKAGPKNYRGKKGNSNR